MRRIDVLTAGLAAPSRWNPLYRRWARRRATENLTVALRALVLRVGDRQDESGRYALTIPADDLAGAARYAGTIRRDAADGSLRLDAAPGRPPRGIRILWDQRG